jgi:spore maturation protein CgeB
MRLLIVGSNRIYAIENFYVKYLRELGVKVLHFHAQHMFYNFYQKNIVNKLTYRLGLSTILKIINERFKKDVEQFEPDIIWIFKGMEILPDSLKWAKKRDIKLVNFNGDSPFIFSGRGSGNSNVTNSISLYDLFLTYSREDKKTMETRHKIRSEILPFGYDLNNSLFEECQTIEEVEKACFLGNPDSYRGLFLNSLASKHIKIDVYGNNWGKFVKHPNIKAFDPVYSDDFWRVLRKYRVQLNLMRPHNPTTHNMRTFETAGVGAIQLAPATEDHKLYFKENEEIFLFKDVESCAEKIAEIKNLSFSEANRIRRNARQRSLCDGYSYERRSAQAFSFLKSFDNLK